MDEVRFYRSGDEDPAVLDGRTIAIVGYGHLGRAVALNLRDSAVTVVVGNIDDDYRPRAVEEGFDATGIPEAVAVADVVFVLIPDEAIPEVFAADIGPNLRPGSAVAFASGYSLAFGMVDPPEHADVVLLAPRMLGEEVRRAYLDRSGFFAYASVERDSTGEAWGVLLALAGAVGALQRGVMELSAEKEALIDLLVEQTFGPVIGGALMTTFHTGVEAGLPPEAMVLELYMSGEMARTFGAFASQGFYRSTTWHGLVAQYGGFIRFGDVDLDAMHERFGEVADDIRSGEFARRLQEEHTAGYPTLAAIEAMTRGEDPITAAEQRVREQLGDG